jgi:meiotically up-regulated gene 157 (Mug157) protein
MWPLNVSLPNRIIATNQAVQDSLHDTSSYEISGLQSPSRLCKSKQSSSSKAASFKEKCPTEVLQEMEKWTLSETSEAKMKRRKERYEKKKEENKNKMQKESRARGIVVTQTTKSSDPHEYRRSVSNLHGCKLRTIEEVDEVDEHVSIRKELNAARVKMVELQQERDMAVDKATKVSIQLAYLKAITDESRDQMTAQLAENHALIEEMRTMRQQGSPFSPGTFKRVMCQQGPPILPGALTCGFLSAKKDGKSVMASNRSFASSNRSVVSSHRSFASSNRSVVPSNPDVCNPFYN